MSASVFHLAVWRELQRTLTELAAVGALDLEAVLIDDRDLAADCRRWRRVRERRVKALGSRLVA